VFQAENAQDFAQKLLQLAEDEQLRRRLGESGRSTVLESHNWAVRSQVLCQLYKGLLIPKPL
jgi:glycosyltransferase involved in cell wall biosynthesis